MIFDIYETLALACLALLLGYFLVKRVKLLNDFNIPEPVVGGFIVAVAVTILNQVWELTFTFDTNLQRTMMLVFLVLLG